MPCRCAFAPAPALPLHQYHRHWLAARLPGLRQASAGLLALSRAHDVLTNEKWSGADLHEIAVQAAAPYRRDAGEDRIALSGPEVRLTPRTAIALALALHELATNAAKYGALSAPGGRVELEWSREGEHDLLMTWREAGAPPSRRPPGPASGHA